MARRWSIALLVSIYALLLGWIDWVMCPNKTEAGHMAAAVYWWHTLRFDVFNVNPPLTRMIIGLPVALCDPKYDWDCYSSRPQDRSEWSMGTAFITVNSPEKTRWCFASRRLVLDSTLTPWRLFRILLDCRDVWGIVCLRLPGLVVLLAIAAGLGRNHLSRRGRRCPGHCGHLYISPMAAWAKLDASRRLPGFVSGCCR